MCGSPFDSQRSRVSSTASNGALASVSNDAAQVEQLTPAAYEHIRGRLRSVPRTMFVAGDDVAGLCAILGSASATPQRPRRRD